MRIYTHRPIANQICIQIVPSVDRPLVTWTSITTYMYIPGKRVSHLVSKSKMTSMETVACSANMGCHRQLRVRSNEKT